MALFPRENATSRSCSSASAGRPATSGGPRTAKGWTGLDGARQANRPKASLKAIAHVVVRTQRGRGGRDVMRCWRCGTRRGDPDRANRGSDQPTEVQERHRALKEKAPKTAFRHALQRPQGGTAQTAIAKSKKTDIAARPSTNRSRLTTAISFEHYSLDSTSHTGFQIPPAPVLSSTRTARQLGPSDLTEPVTSSSNGRLQECVSPWYG